MDDGQCRRDEGQRRRDDRSRYRHEVGRQAHEVQLTERCQEHRKDRELCPDRDTQQRRQPPRHTCRESIPDHRREQQHAGGRGRREHEAERAGEAGIEQDQQQHGHRQRVPSITDVTPGGRQEEHERHRTRSQDARLEAREEREPGHDAGDRHAPHRCGQAEQSDHRHDPADDDRDVRTGDRRQVGQARGLHGGQVGGRQQPRVPGHEADEQTSRPLIEVTGGGLPHPGPEPLRTTGRAAAGPEHLVSIQVEEDTSMLLGEPGPVALSGEWARARRGPPSVAERGR
jgi:hypothetical protein